MCYDELQKTTARFCRHQSFPFIRNQKKYWRKRSFVYSLRLTNAYTAFAHITTKYNSGVQDQMRSLNSGYQSLTPGAKLENIIVLSFNYCLTKKLEYIQNAYFDNIFPISPTVVPIYTYKQRPRAAFLRLNCTHDRTPFLAKP